MRKIDVAELVPGMVVAENIISFSNQLIYPAGYRLTDKAITKLTFYSVPFVCVEDESDHFTYSEMKSYSERVRSTPEFQHFAEEFEKDVYKFKNFLNDVVEKNVPLDIHDILQDIFNFHLYLSSVRVFVSIIYIEIFLLSRDISLFFVFLYFSLLRHLARPGPGSRCPPGGPFDKREKKSSQTDHQAAAPGDRPQNKPAAGLL